LFGLEELTMYLKSCWYVAAWSHEIAAEPLARTLLDLPLVFYRDTAGKVVALDDRCCHRAAPLSLGKIEGDCLRCMYHGLKFDRTGKCVEIPMQENIPPTARVRSYPVVERHRWVWVWMGDPGRADESLLPNTHWLDDPAWASRSGYMLHTANYMQVADNLCDFSHLSFVHQSTVGGSVAYAKSQPRVERIERGVRITRGLSNDEPAPFVAALRPEWTKVDRWNHYEFLVPGIFLMDSGSIPVGMGGEGGSRDGAIEFRSCQAVTPETSRTTHYFYAQPHNFDIHDSVLTDKIHGVLDTAFEEDRRIISGQTRMLAFDPQFKMVPLGVDAALSQYRWVLDRLIKQEAQ